MQMQGFTLFEDRPGCWGCCKRGGGGGGGDTHAGGGDGQAGVRGGR